MPRPLALDELDHRLLAALQANADRTLRDLGEEVGLSPSAVQRRMHRYRRSGLLDRHVAVLDPRFAPEVVVATYLVTIERDSPEHGRRFRHRLLDCPEVQQAYEVSGDFDYLVVIAAVGMNQHDSIAKRLFQDDPNIKRYTTLFVLDPVRTGCSIPTR